VKSNHNSPEPGPPRRLTAAEIARGVAHLRRADARLADTIARVGTCGLAPRGQIYRSLFRAVLYQQLAGAAAAAIERRVYATCGGHPPSPAEFLRVPDAALRAAGLSRQKLSYLRDLAAAFADGRLRPQQLARLDDDAVIGLVTGVRGIGTWTAHMLLMFSLGRPDVLPVGDYGIRKGMQQLYRLRALSTPPVMHRIAAPWRPYRTIAAWYIWRNIDTVVPAAR